MDAVAVYLIVAAAACLSASVAKLVVYYGQPKARPKTAAAPSLQMTQLLPLQASAAPLSRSSLPEVEVTEVKSETPTSIARKQSTEKFEPAAAPLAAAPVSQPAAAAPTPPTTPVQTPPPSEAAPAKSPIQPQSKTPAAHAKLTIVKGHESRTWDLVQDIVFLGRAPDIGCTVPSLTVSRKHACIEKKDGEFYLADCGSKNGTFCNGTKVKEPVRLRNNDTIEIGEIRLSFSLQ